MCSIYAGLCHLIPKLAGPVPRLLKTVSYLGYVVCIELDESYFVLNERLERVPQSNMIL